jgi:cyclohexa-1,5-dienecarbonyl-CoA hydratase
MSTAVSIRTATEQGGQLHRIVLDRPKGNVLDMAMIAALRAEARRVAAARSNGDAEFAPLKLVVFEGAGAHFSFGASVEEHVPELMTKMLPSFHALFEELEAMETPTAALVRGQCLGGGMELATACGRVICEPGARFGVPEVKLGVFPPVAALMLPWRIGGSRATEMILGGGIVEGERAAALGLADACVPDPEAELQRWFAAELAPRSAVAVRFAWRAVRRTIVRALADDLPALERMYLNDLMSYADPDEGIRSFLEKRAPEWKHR